MGNGGKGTYFLGKGNGEHGGKFSLVGIWGDFCIYIKEIMTTLEILLSILTALSGLGNLGQWVNLRAMKDKARYEADDAHIEALKKVIDLQAEEIRRLEDRVRRLESQIMNKPAEGQEDGESD